MDATIDERLKISSDLTQFYRSAFFPMTTIGFTAFALISLSNGAYLIALVWSGFMLMALIMALVNPYKKLVHIYVNLEKHIFIIEEKENVLTEIGAGELEKYSTRSGICKLYFKDKKVFSFVLPMVFENPPKYTVIQLLKEAIGK